MTAEALHKARKPDESVAPTTPKYIDNCRMSGVWVPTLLVPHACADRIVVLIGGEAASGKSTLLEALTTRRGHGVNWHCLDINDYTEPLIEEEFSSVDEYRHKFLNAVNNQIWEWLHRLPTSASRVAIAGMWLQHFGTNHYVLGPALDQP